MHKRYQLLTCVFQCCRERLYLALTSIWDGYNTLHGEDFRRFSSVSHPCKLFEALITAPIMRCECAFAPISHAVWHTH